MQHRPIKILLVESDEDYIDELQDGLGSAHAGVLQLEWVSELSQALARLTQGGFDAILLSLDLPDSHGMVTFDRAFAFAPDVPIIVIADEPDEEAAVSTVQAGAQDYLVKSEVSASLLVRSVRHAIERHRLFSALRSLSLIDDLTGLYNRRGFADLGEQYLKLARRSGRGVTMVYLDLDRFKTINDSLGHHVGDRALLKVADILRAAFRRSDIIARLGGDEFGVLALEAADESAETLVERLRERVVDFNESSPEPYQLSVSIGMVHHDDDPRMRLEDLVAEADAAMYREKHGKRPSSLRGP
ncbi:MAG: diguanylate cyclase [Gemmatimonadetes bacterium]|nr:diguanylate cyclase [Gemmatimonadota bacterium]MDA1104006.1 diguanylate cyclase [Gemmatimonadota bacterium]